jgi:hypothetical protein
MKIVNPKHDDVFREEIVNFMTRISEIMKHKKIDSNLDFEEILKNSGRFSFLHKLISEKIEHPFSNELLTYVKNDMVIPLIRIYFENINLNNDLSEAIIQNTLKLFIYQALDIMDKYPDVKPDDIEINKK